MYIYKHIHNTFIHIHKYGISKFKTVLSFKSGN